MEDEEFILSYEDKLNVVDVGSKSPLVHDLLLNLKDPDALKTINSTDHDGITAVSSYVADPLSSIDDILPQE